MLQRRISKLILVGLILVSAGSLLLAETRLLRNPAVAEESIAFVYANDIWVSSLKGGDARRLTTFPGSEDDPHFSPDGKWIAFTGQYDGNTDVYVISVDGGEPKRLTYHPGADTVRGWTVDGTAVIFSSGRTGVPIPVQRLWKASVEGGFPTALPLPRVFDGSLSPDGKSIAYQLIEPWETEFRNYRGGQTNPVRIANLETLAVEKLPWEGSNDLAPVWMDDTVYFLSDRDFVSNIWAYNTKSQKLQQLTDFKEMDVKRLDASHGVVVFEQNAQLHTLDPKNGKTKTLSFNLQGDFPWMRPHWENVGSRLSSPGLSPTGKRAVFEARGEIFTVPAKNGNWRNLSNASASADRDPAWSPDGQKISWFSDRNGEYELFIADQHGKIEKSIKLENPTFYYTPSWSPDSKYISFGDADRNLWVLQVEDGTAKLIDNEGYAHPDRIIYPEWAPDSKWIAYAKRLDNQYAVVMVYSIETGETHQVTSALSDCRAPAWDRSGKYLYFMSSTDYGLNVGWLDMSSYQRPVTRAIYMALLSKDQASPLLPESDEEEVKKEEKKDEKSATDAATTEEDSQKSEDKSSAEAKDDAKEDSKASVKIDFEGLAQRIVALDLPERDYQSLTAGPEGTLFYTESVPNERGVTLHRWTLKDRESKKLLDNVRALTISADGKKLLYASNGGWAITDAAGMPKPGDGALKTADIQMKVDPMSEWTQIFREAWRYQRDYFYVENVHGLDLDWAYKTYAPWVKHARHRSDLNYILDILGGETAIGHSFTGGGDMPDVDRVPVGLLGADYEVVEGRYRISKIYTGESWNANLKAPLAAPGIKVGVGDYILAVNGVELTSETNLYSLFDQTAGRQTRLTVGPNSDGSDSREVDVTPVNNEYSLRTYDWIEGNRRKVDELSDGKLAYVWLPNTGQGGYNNFNRYYFAQKDKKGAVIDERFNGGGSAADYIIDLLARPLMGYFNNPVGDKRPFTNPNAGIWGPKVMIINDSAGSGGDLMPYMFRLRKIGPLVGTKTWGGLVGIWDVPALIDGGRITAPRGGYYNLDGEWDVENIGVAPDIEVEQDPKAVADGGDPQLEKAVETALKLLETEGIELKPQPADPIRVKRPQ